MKRADVGNILISPSTLITIRAMRSVATLFHSNWAQDRKPHRIFPGRNACQNQTPTTLPCTTCLHRCNAPGEWSAKRRASPSSSGWWRRRCFALSAKSPISSCRGACHESRTSASSYWSAARFEAEVQRAKGWWGGRIHGASRLP